MHSQGKSVCRGWNRFSRILLYVAGASFWVATAVTVGDVVMRFLFSVTLPATMEISTLFVAAGVLLGLPGCFSMSGHIEVTLLTDLVGARLRRLLGLFGAVMALAFMGLLVAIFAIHAVEYAGSIRRLPDTGLNYFAAIVCVASGFGLSVIGAASALRSKFGEQA